MALATAYNKTKKALTRQEQLQYLPFVLRMYNAGLIPQAIFTFNLKGLGNQWNDSYTPYDLQNARQNMGTLSIGGLPEGRSYVGYSLITYPTFANDCPAEGRSIIGSKFRYTHQLMMKWQEAIHPTLLVLGEDSWRQSILMARSWTM